METFAHKFPSQASEYLQINFPEGFQFDEFREDSDESGRPIFVAWINDGSLQHQFIFSGAGELQHHDIIPAYPEDIFSDTDEFHEDDF